MARSHLFAPAALLLAAWGALAFGSEFTWAYTPLLVFALAVSVLGVMAARGLGGALWRPFRPLIAAFVVLFAAAVFQAAPLPTATVAALSPARNAVDYPKLYAKYDLDDYQPDAPQEPARTITIEPTRTKLGLAFLAVWSVLLICAAIGFGAVRPTMFARGMVVVGVIAAFAELTQRTNRTSLLYGFFPLHQQNGNPGAPFINRNHTAGFLDMTIALSVGYLISCVSVGWRKVKPDWRSRLLWFSSAPAAEALMVIFAVFVMATAVVASQSRSGSLCLTLILLMFTFAVVGHSGSRARKAAILGVLAAALAAAAAFGDVSGVIDRFLAEPISNAGGRLEIWRSALAIIHDFRWVGTGLNTFGIAGLHYQPDTQDIAIEAHNEYLQLAAEGGVLLCVPAAAAVAALIVLIRRRFAARTDDQRVYWLRVGAAIALAIMAVQSLFDFTLQMAGGAAMFILLAAIAIHRPWVTSRSA